MRTTTRLGLITSWHSIVAIAAVYLSLGVYASGGSVAFIGLALLSAALMVVWLVFFAASVRVRQ